MKDPSIDRMSALIADLLLGDLRAKTDAQCLFERRNEIAAPVGTRGTHMDNWEIGPLYESKDVSELQCLLGLANRMLIFATDSDLPKPSQFYSQFQAKMGSLQAEALLRNSENEILGDVAKKHTAREMCSELVSQVGSALKKLLHSSMADNQARFDGFRNESRNKFTSPAAHSYGIAK